ncbi:NAD(P)-dependent oxidoreductase [Oceanidesulfovibrio marinus]|uniref:NAD(P)-dependent oxidoreductase n=1 Tax=Oceanidesulfovibrio marinus TaxID=370038 RepID=A0ABX6NF70_9BACT|nr:NAD(P)-dependent oxidoreductase [Oceanidesulfovibrio marinus]QJT09257.1 NAD(P)-dependent oxidoreductase [Oceanidesulfovibrio marinus]
MPEAIGFVGMGIMGVPMALNLVKAGFDVTVTNRTIEKCKPLADAGATVAESPEDISKRTPIIVTMLTGPQAVDQALFGEDGAAAGLGKGKLVINMSSVPPSYSKDLARRVGNYGASFIDAPVSGSKKPAEDGTLVILAGGEADQVERATPYFEAMGKKTIHCGPAGSGSHMKMSINLLLGSMLSGLAEMLAFGEKGGLSREVMLNVVLAGPLSNELFAMKRDLLASNEYTPQFPAKHMAKDLKFALDTAHETGAWAPATHLAAQLYRMLVAADRGDEDFSAVFDVLRGAL